MTGSFDFTSKLWCGLSGACKTTYCGHSAEVVSVDLEANYNRTLCSTSLDGTAKIFDVETAHELQSINHHSAEVITGYFNNDGTLILTASFDHSAAIWDTKSKQYIHTTILKNLH